MSPLKPLALYLHVPFCAAKCAYCDFASYPNRESEWKRYFDALQTEITDWKPTLADYEIQTIFFGGGTPSLVPPEYLAETMARIHKTARVAPEAEITLEANPGTLTDRKAKIYREAGFNRLSVGAQAMEDRLLCALGRIHRASDVVRAADIARRNGFDNLSFDLMYALPGQTMEDWRHTLDAAVALRPQHISAYSLIVEEGTPLERDVSSGRIAVPDDDCAVEMQRVATERLRSAGYKRYEISNYAREGWECRHNVTYWTRGEYLGLGCAAHSLMRGERFENPSGLEAYLSGERRLSRTVISQEDAMEETLMLSTRMTRGMDLAAYQARFGVDFAQKNALKLERLARMGLIEMTDGFLRLTEKGLEVQNAVVVELLDE